MTFRECMAILRAKAAEFWQYWSVRFGALLLVTPEMLAFVRDNFSTLDPFLPDILQPRLLQLIGLAIMFLRLRRMMVA